LHSEFLKGTALEKAVWARIRAEPDAEAIPQGGDGEECEEMVVPEVPVAIGEDHAGHTEASGHPTHHGLTAGSNPDSSWFQKLWNYFSSKGQSQESWYSQNSGEVRE